jgi:site-specific recombinase XerD
MARLRPPKIPAQLTPVLDDAAIQSLIKACAGKDFAELRDTAIVRLFLDTGMRLDELAKLRVDDLDLDYDNTATVLGKGRRPRICPFGAKTAQALDRYLRQRARQKRSGCPAARVWQAARALTARLCRLLDDPAEGCDVGDGDRVPARGDQPP